MKIIRVPAVQAHAVPKHAHAPRGPFPPAMQGFNQRSVNLNEDGSIEEGSDYIYEDDANMAAQPEIVTDYMPEQNEDGYGFLPGSTAQNNFKPEKHYRCRTCHVRLLEHELDDHDCEE